MKDGPFHWTSQKLCSSVKFSVKPLIPQKIQNAMNFDEVAGLQKSQGLICNGLRFEISVCLIKIYSHWMCLDFLAFSFIQLAFNLKHIYSLWISNKCAVAVYTGIVYQSMKPIRWLQYREHNRISEDITPSRSNEKERCQLHKRCCNDPSLLVFGDSTKVCGIRSLLQNYTIFLQVCWEMAQLLSRSATAIYAWIL